MARRSRLRAAAVMRLGFAMAWRLAAAQLAVWMPLYRPLGEAIYAACFALFGFNPAPLEIFGWLLLVANVVSLADCTFLSWVKHQQDIGRWRERLVGGPFGP